MKTDVSVVIPVYRSAENIGPLVARIMAACNDSNISCEIILVNDCSPDSSWDAIIEQARLRPEVIGINLRRNVGQDNALMAGFHHTHGDVVIVMDDDLQHDPLDIPRLYAGVRAGYDICYARFLTKHQAWWKNAGSMLSGAISGILLGKPHRIYMSPYKAIAGDVVKEIVAYQGPFPYVDGLLLSATGNVTQIEATHHSRHTGHSNYTLARSVRVWLKLVTGFSVVPLRAATVLGFFVSGSSFILACAYLYLHFALEFIVEGWTTLIVVSLFLGGCQLIGIGLIGEYLGRAYLLLNRRPQFGIREIVPGTSQDGLCDSGETATA